LRAVVAAAALRIRDVAAAEVEVLPAAAVEAAEGAGADGAECRQPARFAMAKLNLNSSLNSSLNVSSARG
jgi:hypothetical protein